MVKKANNQIILHTCILGMRMHIIASRHGALSIILAEVTVTNDIPKHYSRELMLTNDIHTAYVRTHVHTHWPKCGPGLAASY